MPTGVALTTKSASLTSAAPPSRRRLAAACPPAHVPHGPGQRSHVAGFLLVRFTTVTEAAPASANASVTARAAPPAPMTRQRVPFGSKPAARASEARNPAPSVLAPYSAPSRLITQLTAPSRPATALRSSMRAATSALCGMVTETPATPRARRPSSAAATFPAATSNPTEIQLSPSAAKAALCRRGEREWRTGEPMTPTTVVRASVQPGPGTAADAISPPHAAVPTSRWPAARRRCPRKPPYRPSSPRRSTARRRQGMHRSRERLR